MQFLSKAMKVSYRIGRLPIYNGFTIIMFSYVLCFSGNKNV